ncbi:hypothetical protein [Clostridium estertheticum]|nr:hypothetical protein [Clostridium estertheticum]
MMRFLMLRINDSKILALIKRFLKADMLTIAMNNIPKIKFIIMP